MPVYLVAAYIVFWAFPMVLLYSIWSRQRDVERKLNALASQVEQVGKPADRGSH